MAFNLLYGYYKEDLIYYLVQKITSMGLDATYEMDNGNYCYKKFIFRLLHK